MTTDLLERPLRISFYVTLSDDHPLVGWDILRLGKLDGPHDPSLYLDTTTPITPCLHTMIHLLRHLPGHISSYFRHTLRLLSQLYLRV